MSEYIVANARPNQTVLKTTTRNGYEHEMWLPVREEIVRCRDCKRATIDQGDHDYREPLWCSLHRMDVPPDSFCAWGEKVVEP